MWRFWLAIAYLSPTLMASPCQAAPAPSKQNKKLNEVTLAHFIEKLGLEGKVTKFPDVFTEVSGVWPGSKTLNKAFGAAASETTDGAGRVVALIHSESEPGKGPVPAAVYWSTMRTMDRKSEILHYRTALDGTFEAAFRRDGELGENGRAIPGGTLTKLDISAAEIRERFQRDVLDFWLKGKGRKKAGTKASKKSSKP